MTIDLIGLARLSHLRSLTEVLEAVYGAPLPPSRASIPELARDLAAAGVPPSAQPVVLVEDQTRPNPVARGRAGEVRNGVGGECHGFLIRPRALTLLTVTRIRFESPDPSADIHMYARPLTGVAAIVNLLPTVSLTPELVRAQVWNARAVAPIPTGSPMPFELDEDAPLVLRGTADDDAAGEPLMVWARTPNTEVRWQIEWSEEPLSAAQAYVP